MGRRAEFVVEPKEAGLRLDQALAEKIPGLSRTHARRLIDAGAVFVDKKRTKIAGKKVQAGQRVTTTLAAPSLDAALTVLVEEEITVRHEDDDCLVVEKPSGLFSAPTLESDRNTVLEALRAHGRLHLVHRLDRPTSGLMVLGKTPKGAAALSELFRTHAIERSYLALLSGLIEERCSVALPLDEREARSDFEPLDVRAGVTLARVHLHTGRTHQVRRHAESLGTPVLGDSKYGRGLLRARGLPRPPRLALHAEVLGFIQPLSGTPLHFVSPLPSALAAYWNALSPSLASNT